MSIENQLKYYEDKIAYRKKIQNNFIAKNKKIIDDLETKKAIIENVKNNYSNIRNIGPYNN